MIFRVHVRVDRPGRSFTDSSLAEEHPWRAQEICSSEPMMTGAAPAETAGRSEESFRESRGRECLRMRQPFKSVLQIFWALGCCCLDCLEFPSAFSDSRVWGNARRPFGEGFGFRSPYRATACGRKSWGSLRRAPDHLLGRSWEHLLHGEMLADQVFRV